MLLRHTLKPEGHGVSDFSVIAALGFVNMKVSGAVNEGGRWRGDLSV